ncbi:hypothetical protein [Flavobacterium cellulosilyticum]|uniref:Uncharacterized protein n=1 Tax=Flavobacterium cellulosilyticum TaxID=2541731 RepID=A0A4V2YZ43_9FLAO|nr:hypothetical protein [Flavobacterium cellulosilyticum]TDD95517.1 hypothetical protein E0F76_13705 [Flavobacterium cellulosilyticum]
MKTNIKYIIGAFFLLFFLVTSCTEETYSLGELKAPTNIVINTEVVGKDATHPNGNGTGQVKISITGDNILGSKIDYDANNAVEWVILPSNSVTKTFDSATGINTYKVTVVVSGIGGTSTNLTKDITVRYDFTPDPVIVTNVTNNSSKSWVVDKSVAGHLGVGPWSGSVTPEWYAAAINEKAACCNCLYTTKFTFAKVAATGTYTLTVASPDGIFTKTGALAGGLPGIPATGDEGCYPYAGGTSDFVFSGSSTGIAASTPSTQVAIKLSGTNTFIGYGATLKAYEIMVVTPTYMYLRVQGTETGNAWYLKLKPAL